MVSASDLSGLMQHNPAFDAMHEMLRDPSCTEVQVNAHDQIWVKYVDRGLVQQTHRIFTGPDQYIQWINELLRQTNSPCRDITTATSPTIDASLRGDLRGAIHVTHPRVSMGEPVLTVRKQPADLITLDQMVANHMMSVEMYQFLVAAMHGRANIIVSGGSGTGKTTMAKALGQHISPDHRVATIEDTDELRLREHLHNVVTMFSHTEVDEAGNVLWEADLADLVSRAALRQRIDRIWVGETLGKEAYALVKAANSGHDGSVTTLHADSGEMAVRQLVSYMTENGSVARESAQEQVARGFDLVVQVSFIRPGVRKVTEITQLEDTIEGKGNQRINRLYSYSHETGGFQRETGGPTPALLRKFEKYGVNLDTYVHPPR